MIKLFSLKQQKKDEESAGGPRAGAGGKKASAAQLRIQKGTRTPSTPPQTFIYQTHTHRERERISAARSCFRSRPFTYVTYDNICSRNDEE